MVTVEMVEGSLSAAVAGGGVGVAGGLEERDGLAGALRAGGEVEVARGDEAVDELAALSTAVLVDHGEGDVAHVPDDRVAEDDQQQERQREGEQEAAAVAAQGKKSS